MNENGTKEHEQPPEVEASAHDALVTRHWFCMTYIGRPLDGTAGTANACSYVGFAEKKITMAKINAQKKHAGVKDDAVLIACIYLGQMTREEFLGG